MSIVSVPLDKSYRLLNHGPTVLVSAAAAGQENVMSASWACALDFSPAKVTVVIDKQAYTRTLIEKSGWFALQVPVASQVEMVMGLGSESLAAHPDKLKRLGVACFYPKGFAVPLVEGCVAWLVCKLLPEPHNQHAHDLFIGEVKGAWADDRVFKAGHWQFEAADSLRTLHYVAGGQFYLIGQGLNVKEGP